MPSKIIFYTGNKGKVREIKTELEKFSLDIDIEMKDVDIPEIQSVSNEEVIKHKLNEIKKTIPRIELLRTSFMVEDTGLYISNMNGFPGALVKFYLDSVKTEGISKFNGGSRARAETWIGLWDANTQCAYYFTGSIEGKISTTPKGTNGFGYDPIFIPNRLNEYELQTGNDPYVFIKENETERTYAELTDEEKAACNMRTIAGSVLAKYLSVTR